MASLSSLIQTKSAIAQISEENLDKGQVFVFAHGTYTQNFRCQFCWIAPSNGTATIEIWGAGGSASRMCCCGIGIPGNPGAYAKKTVAITSGQCVYGNTGMSCGNASQLCFRGCSCNTGICIQNDSCMCAQGGRGGMTPCVNSSGSIFCCFGSTGHCITSTGTGCGIVCNYGSGFLIPQAYGGDINCQGQFSCIVLGHCNPTCWCCHTGYVRTSANIYGTCPATIQVNHDASYNRGGFGRASFFQGLAGASASPTHGNFYDYCWSSGSYCGCYETSGCVNEVPVGVPAPGSTPCSSVRDHGLRGGHGAVRISFISSE